jgi:plastocyanin domain-containing protein
MTTRRLFTLGAAAALTVALPAAAQHDHGAMHQKTAAAAAGIAEGTVKDGVRTVEMQVTEDGFVPAKVKANKGEKLRLVVTRRTERTCATEIVVKDQGIEKKLPLNQPVTVEFTPSKSGELRYACGMGHITGVVFVP